MNETPEIYRNNHLRLMRVHIGLALFYALIFIPPYLLAPQEALPDNRLLMAVYAVLIASMSLLHLALAYGARRKNRLSRKVSELIFAVMLLAFPIGTVLSLYFFLPTTQWAPPKN